ncbi:hypothetical protein J0X19_12660 [Hymenobacter sp. BT186]|uniref:Uncharacterized protein n=1 Tax=Hymenobacter telluris TaxID=2816474 RepID=A0A939EX47_9BACT|nr:hypothetical protein [Hymenobacter telluris]MBO0358802.1 hypothetical protein [Hymenobacter telluris]MBW3374828.1 hypothetical protein [Hymenobacter norwichensis]
MSVLKLIQRIVILLNISWSLYGCEHKTEVLVPVQVTFDNMRFELPESWKTHRVLPVFPADCLSCSGTEYAETFGDDSTRGVFIQVSIIPRNVVSSVLNCKRELIGLREKNHNLVVIDTLSTTNGHHYIEIGYENADDNAYHKMVKYIGSYRTITLNFRGECSSEFEEIVERIQKTVYVNPDFLVSTKL